jgi:nicotinate-nucleotide adenylyltransferase
MISRIGIFGGSFDPVHTGHLIIASDICDRLMLGTVHFVLSPRPPHKAALWATDEHRREMLAAAIADDPRFALDLREYKRTGPSWTVDTVASFADEFPAAERFFIMGEDSLADFHTWREPERILANVQLAVATRPGVELSPRHLHRFSEDERARIHVVESPEIGISSTLVRERIARGASIRYLVPEMVERYIRAHRPYGQEPELSE